jgi:UDP-N-acetyl-D-galactosamine dehydrogenase
MKHGRKIAVIGLGYVGLPVAVSFARSGVQVIGFDIDAARVAELGQGNDRTREVEAEDLGLSSLVFTGGTETVQLLHRHRADADR